MLASPGGGTLPALVAVVVIIIGVGFWFWAKGA
jgi:hypothetical protein